MIDYKILRYKFSKDLICQAFPSLNSSFSAGHAQPWCLSHPGLHRGGRPEPSDENLWVQACGQKSSDSWHTEGTHAPARSVQFP